MPNWALTDAQSVYFPPCQAASSWRQSEADDITIRRDPVNRAGQLDTETPTVPGIERREAAKTAPTSVRPREPGSAGEPTWAKAAFLGSPWLVWLLVVAFLASLVSYAFLVPIYRNPDEHNHVDLVLHMRRANSYPEFDEAMLSRQVTASMASARYREGRPPAYGRSLAGEAVPRARRPTFDELAPDEPSPMWNGVANHPFLYYLLVGKSLALVSNVWPGADRWHYDQTVVVMRLLGVLLIAPLPLLAFAAARRFGASPAVSVAAALFPLINPQVVREGASVNNGGLLIMLAGVLTLLLVRVWTGDRSARTAVLVGVTLGLALLTKGFALALVPWVGLAYARAWWHGPRRPTLYSGALALGLAAVLGGWWWGRNLIVYGTIQTELEGRWRRRQFDPDTLAWARRFAGRVTGSFWGFFVGQFDLPLARAAVLTPIVLATAATVVGIAVSPRVRDLGRWTPAATPFLLWPVVGILVILVPGAYSIYAESRLLCCMHGRYLLPGVTAIGLAVAIGWGWLLGRRQHLLPVGALALGALLQVVGVIGLLALHWGPPNPTIHDSLVALLAWAPWRGRYVAALFAVCALVAALVAMRVVWVSIRSAPDRRLLPSPPT
jgi:Dolichyl-phosphate-mannose-protein mannosyltransferase